MKFTQDPSSSKFLKEKSWEKLKPSWETFNTYLKYKKDVRLVVTTELQAIKLHIIILNIIVLANICLYGSTLCKQRFKEQIKW